MHIRAVTHSCDSAKGSELTWKQRCQTHFKRSEMPSLPIWRVSGSGPGLLCLPLLWLVAASSLFDDPNVLGIRGSCRRQGLWWECLSKKKKKRPYDRFLCRTGMFDLLADTWDVLTMPNAYICYLGLKISPSIWTWRIRSYGIDCTVNQLI